MELTSLQKSAAKQLYDINCNTSDDLLRQLTNNALQLWSLQPIFVDNKTCAWSITIHTSTTASKMFFNGNLAMFKNYYVALTIAVNAILKLDTTIDNTMIY